METSRVGTMPHVSEEHCRLLLRATTSIFWITDAEGNFVAPQPSWSDYTGQTWQQMCHLGWLNALHPDDRRRIRELWKDARTAITLYKAQGRLWHAASGAYRHCEARGVPVVNGDGSVREWVGTCEDVEDRMQPAEALRESKERFARFMHHLPGLAWIKDVEGRYVYVNDEAEKVFRTPREKLYGKTDEELFPPEVAAQFRENDGRALTAGTGVQTVELLEHEDGVVHHSIVSKFPIPGRDGQPILVGGIAIDITERKRAEKALRESEQRFRHMADAAPVLIWIRGADNRCTWFNKPWLNFVGRPMEKELGNGWADNVHPDDLDLCINTCVTAFDARRPFSLEYRLRRHDGVYRWVLDTGIPLYGPCEGASDEFTGYIGSCLDITDRKQAEAALKTKEAELELVAEMTPLILTRCSRDLRYLFANRAAAAMFDLTPDQMIGKPIIDVMGEEPFAIIKPYIDRALRGEPVEFEVEIPYQVVGPRWVRVHYNPDRDDRGEVIGWVASVVDITDRKRAEAQLKASVHEKDVLLREIHHRVKNNLQVISSLIDLQVGNVLDPTKRAELAELSNRVRAMWLVHERLYLAPNVAEVDAVAYVRSLLDTLWDAHSDTAAKVRLKLALEPLTLPIEPAVPLGLILNELASNTLKHAFRGKEGEFGGEVTVGLQHDPSTGQVCLRVRDNGVGLPRGLNWEQPVSLGLRLVLILTRQLCGSIEMDNHAGTEFRVRFPLSGGKIPPMAR